MPDSKKVKRQPAAKKAAERRTARRQNPPEPEPRPNYPHADEVTEASIESFPASDAPAWGGSEIA